MYGDKRFKMCICTHSKNCKNKHRANFISKLGKQNIETVRCKSVFVGWNEEHKFWMQHATIQQILDLYDEDLSDYFKFSFVRNPFERVVSIGSFKRNIK